MMPLKTSNIHTQNVYPKKQTTISNKSIVQPEFRMGLAGCLKIKGRNLVSKTCCVRECGGTEWPTGGGGAGGGSLGLAPEDEGGDGKDEDEGHEDLHVAGGRPRSVTTVGKCPLGGVW